MARNDKETKKANRRIAAIMQGVSDNVDGLYRNTYMANPQSSKDIKDLTARINDNIDNIVNRNMDIYGMPSVSKLYSRIAASNKNEKDITDSLETMFDNGLMTDDLYGMFMSNRYLKELDNEIDTVCKYMPKLEEALQVQKDCVLSADHFSKDFLNLIPIGVTGTTTSAFNERIADLKRKYKLPQLVEEIYEDMSKYGEKFIYRVPLSVAIGRLLATKPDTQLIAPGSLKEGANEQQSDSELFLFTMKESASEFIDITTNAHIQKESAVIISEAVTTTSGKSNAAPDGKLVTSPILNKNESFNIAVEICRSNIIESAVRNTQSGIKKRERLSENSLVQTEQAAKFFSEADNSNMEAKGNINIGADRKDTRIIANDGLITGKRLEPVKVRAPGCVIKKLPRDHVVPIYIEDLCMGYYFFELRTMDDSESFMGFKNILGDPLTNMRGDHRTAFNTVDNQRQDQTIKYVAGQLSKFIDKQFVNSNQDIAKEIYMILKYNDLFNTPSIDRIKVTFVPPEDMVHFYFRQDPITHRGISDLDKALIPGKIYSSLYITTSIGTLTRGQDKRVYYVKQTVDTNIAQTLLNTISQIKQGNFGIRQFQNINNILNITGRFNDFVIPTSASGEAPIQFEIMPGQNIETPTELMDALEEMAINSTGIPIEIIQARQSVDYAMQLTMSSSKVLRFCYKRQELYQDLLREFLVPVYNYEYNESIDMRVTLPPPTFINITNTNQLVDNTRNFVQSLVDVEMADEEDEKLKATYSRELFKYYLGTHLNTAAHKDILDRAKMLTETNKGESHADNNDGGDNYGY